MKYKDYLNSPQWRFLRKVARYRSGNRCELCGGPANHVHHVKYPKRLEDDHLDNLVVVCEACHKLSHGIRNTMNKNLIKAEKKIEIPMNGIIEGLVTAFVIMDSEGSIWFTEETITGLLNRGSYSFRRSFMAQAMLIVPPEDKGYVILDGIQIDVVSEPGLYETMVWCKGQEGFDNEPVKRLLRKMTKEVMPSIRKYGVYPAPTGKPSDGLVAQAKQLLVHAERIEKLEEEQEKIKFNQAMLHEEHVLESKKIDGVIEELRVYTGGDYHKTARLWLLENKLPVHHRQALGYRATCIATKRGLKLEKIAEGSFLANQYPKEILHEAAKELGILDQNDFFND